MTRLSKTFILLCILAAMVVTASAGSLSGGAGSSAGVSGNGMAASYAWDAEYQAGYDLVGTADHPGASFSTSMTDNSQDGTNPGDFPAVMVQVKAKELKVSGKVTGPSDGSGFAQAIASVRALANREIEDAGVAQDGLTLETWIFAATHTYAGSDGVTATASATASGTATASGETEYGSAMAESKGTAKASSSATYTGESSGSVSAAMIGAVSHVGEGSYFAGYPSYTYTPISEFHEFAPFDYIVYPYFYPGNGLATVNILDGTGYAKSSASGSATASADSPVDFSSSSSECEPVNEPVVKTSSSGTVASGVSGDWTEAGAISGINAWAFVEEPDEEDGFQEGYLPTAVLDAGSTIFAAGGVYDEPAGYTALSTNGNKKIVDTATFSASGKSSGMITIEPEYIDENSASQFDGMMADLDATTSGSISGSATQDYGGASGTANAIAARALGYPSIIEGDPGIEWGILLPSIEELNMITWNLGAEEGMLYSMLGSASGSTQVDGTGATTATISGSATASGDGSYLLLGSAQDDLIIPEPGISGTACAGGTIKSSTKALPFGDAATTSQIFAGGGEGPLYGGAMVDYYDPELFLDFSSEVGGMSYLTTMDYAASESIPFSVATSSGKSSKVPTTSATSSVSGSAKFEGSSVMIDGLVIPVDIVPSYTDGGTDLYPIVLVDGEDHEASSSAKGTVAGTASASNMGEADTGSLIFSASGAELNTEGLTNGIVDYSLILSDSSAISSSEAQTASAKGSADGSTTATSSLDYTDFSLGDPIAQWEQFLESTTTANGKMTTDAKACGNSNGNAVAELKSYNAIEPAEYTVEWPDTVYLDYPATINDDSVLVSAARAMGGDSSSDKSSATATLTGSTSSSGSHEATIEWLEYPIAPGGDSIPVEPLPPEWVVGYNEMVDGGTSVSNTDKATASGTGSMGTYEGIAFNYACADQMTILAPDGKVAFAQGVFGADASTPTPGSDITAEATISNVKVNAYADPTPPMTMAEIIITGGKASAKVMPSSPYSKAAYPTFSSMTAEVYPLDPVLGGGFNTGTGSDAVLGHAMSAAGAVADSRVPYPVIGELPTIPEILHPAIFWS